MSIFLNKKQLVLAPNHSVTLVRNNPLFGGKDGFTMPVVAPLEPNVNAIDNLSNPRVTGSRKQLFEVDQYVNTLHLMRGSAQITQTENNVEMDVNLNLLDFLQRTQKVKVKDISWPKLDAFMGVGRAFTIQAELLSTLTTEKDYVAFPFLYSWITESGVRAERIFNYWVHENEGFPHGEFVYGLHLPGSISLRMHAIVRCIFNYYGYNVKYNCLALDEMKGLCHISATEPSNLPVDDVSYGDFLPNISIKQIIETVMGLGCDFHINNITREVYIYFKNDVINAPVKKIDGWLDSEKITTNLKTGVKIAFEKDNNNSFGGSNDMEYKQAALIKSESFSTTFADLPDAEDNEDEYRWVRDECMFYKSNGTKWQLAGGFVPDYIVGEAENEFIGNVSPVYNKRVSPLYNTEYIIPVLKIDDQIPTGLCLTVFRGLKEMSDENSVYDFTPYYPYANYLPVDPLGQSFEGFALTPCGENDNEIGLNTFVGDYVDFMENSYEIKTKLLKPISYIVHPDHTSPINYKNQKAFLKSLSVKANDTLGIKEYIAVLRIENKV